MDKDVEWESSQMRPVRRKRPNCQQEHSSHDRVGTMTFWGGHATQITHVFDGFFTLSLGMFCGVETDDVLRARLGRMAETDCLALQCWDTAICPCQQPNDRCMGAIRQPNKQMVKNAAPEMDGWLRQIKPCNLPSDESEICRLASAPPYWLPHERNAAISPNRMATQSNKTVMLNGTVMDNNAKLKSLSLKWFKVVQSGRAETFSHPTAVYLTMTSTHKSFAFCPTERISKVQCQMERE